MYVYTTLERSEGCPLQHPAEAAPSVDLSFRLGKKTKKCYNNYFYSVVVYSLQARTGYSHSQLKKK